MGESHKLTEISNNTLLELLTKKIDQKFDELVSNIKRENESLTQQLLAANRNIDKLEKEKQILADRVTILEKRTRKNNIAVFGLEIQTDNFTESCIAQINSLLQINITQADISDIYQPKNNPKAPVIVELLSAFKRREIFSKLKDNADALKKSKVFITNDLSLEDREILKILRRKKAEAEKDGQVAKIFGRYVVIDGVKYGYRELQLSEDNKSDSAENDEYEDVSDSDHGDVNGVLYRDNKDSQQKTENPGKRKNSKTPSPPTRVTRLTKRTKT